MRSQPCSEGIRPRVWCTQDKQRFTSVSVATSPNSSRVLGMNIHGARSSVPSSLRTRQFDPLFPVLCTTLFYLLLLLLLFLSPYRSVSLRTGPRPFATPYDIHRTASSQRLKSQYAFVRLTKSTGPGAAKANRTRRLAG